MFLLIPSCRPPPFSAGAGVGNQAALLRHKTRFLSFVLGLGCFLPGWAGLGAVPAFFRPADPPAQCQAMVWVIGSLNWGTGL